MSIRLAVRHKKVYRWYFVPVDGTVVVPIWCRLSSAGCPIYIVKSLGTHGISSVAGCEVVPVAGIVGWHIPALYRDHYRIGEKSGTLSSLYISAAHRVYTN